MLELLPNSWIVKIQQVSIRGTPDFLVCLSGVFVAIELKTDEGVLDALQKWNLECIALSGGIAMVMTPKNLGAQMNILREIAHEGRKHYKENQVFY